MSRHSVTASQGLDSGLDQTGRSAGLLRTYKDLQNYGVNLQRPIGKGEPGIYVLSNGRGLALMLALVYTGRHTCRGYICRRYFSHHLQKHA